ncbi:MAG: rhodanese-like domain-containing protein [Pseudomonadota bacterium]|nr:rhodanese-like domain-containing protein [Pseudomonadota bacterium]MEC8673812.1 rhodanese-like domain-containing protein [Pseudomonadota bacterium]
MSGVFSRRSRAGAGPQDCSKACLYQLQILPCKEQPHGREHDRADGELFDASRPLGQAFSFTLGEGQVMLYCRSGNRTTSLGNALIDQLGFSNVSHLSSGITGWLAEGRETVFDRD